MTAEKLMRKQKSFSLGRITSKRFQKVISKPLLKHTQTWAMVCMATKPCRSKLKGYYLTWELLLIKCTPMEKTLLPSPHFSMRKQHTCLCTHIHTNLRKTIFSHCSVAFKWHMWNPNLVGYIAWCCFYTKSAVVFYAIKGERDCKAHAFQKCVGVE